MFPHLKALARLEEPLQLLHSYVPGPNEPLDRDFDQEFATRVNEVRGLKLSIPEEAGMGEEEPLYEDDETLQEIVEALDRVGDPIRWMGWS